MLPLDLYARVRVLCAQLHTRPRVQRAPGLPCALCYDGGQRSTQPSGDQRREIAKLYPPVIAREAKQSIARHSERRDCFASLAMTGLIAGFMHRRSNHEATIRRAGLFKQVRMSHFALQQV